MPATPELTSIDHCETVVIGGGQAGLVVGYELKQRGRPFIIVDASERVGDAWRNRWDSLRLFTPARYNGLPGLPFPGGSDTFVHKDDVADYLESYAAAMELPVFSGVRVERLARWGDRFVISTDGHELTADNVVVAMAGYQLPKTPGFASDLDPALPQLHAAEYRNPAQIPAGPVLVVGMGNSGAEIALELAGDHEVYISGRQTATIPFRIEPWWGRSLGVRLVRFLALRVLNTSTPIGRKARPKMLPKAAPLVRVKPRDLRRAGVTRLPRVTGASGGRPLLEDGQVLEVGSVVWCTGYSPGFDWIDLQVIGEDGHPRYDRGVVTDEPGLYFCGLFFLHALWSETITGVQIDARHIAEHLDTHRPRTQAAEGLGTLPNGRAFPSQPGGSQRVFPNGA